MNELTNPVNLETQFVGIYKRDMLLPVAQVLQKLGRKQALVVNGSGFLDEASLQGENHVVILKDNEIVETSIEPEKYGFSIVKNEEIRGGNSKENAKITLGVLSGEKVFTVILFYSMQDLLFSQMEKQRRLKKE